MIVLPGHCGASSRPRLAFERLASVSLQWSSCASCDCVTVCFLFVLAFAVFVSVKAREEACCGSRFGDLCVADCVACEWEVRCAVWFFADGLR